jgi:1,4-alpha-glucan branching enzyme
MARSLALLVCVTVSCAPASVRLADRAPRTTAASPALGATVTASGTTFRVWAPHADAVYVRGSWNGFASPGVKLARDPDPNAGTFTLAVAAARAGDDYLYTIDHGPDRLSRADPRARRMRGERGASVIDDPSSYAWRTGPFVPPDVASLIVYELHIPTFAPGGSGEPGTLRSATLRLPDLAELGINVVELMPPAEAAGRGGWGYGPTAPLAVETDFGTPDDLKAFIDRCHELGIAVLVDWVAGHINPTDSQLLNFDGESLGADGIYFYANDLHDSCCGAPRPNYDEPQVASLFFESMMQWLSEYRFDGARVDAFINMRQTATRDVAAGWQLGQRINDAAHRLGKLMIAEDLMDWDEIVAPASDGRTFGVYVGGAGFDAQWDDSYSGADSFYLALRDAVAAPTDAARDLHAVARAITHGFAGGAFRRVIYTETHDRVAPQHPGANRLPVLIAPQAPTGLAARKRSTLAAAVLLTSPGIPLLFQGQEFLEVSGFDFPVPPALNWSNQRDQAGVRTLYRDLIALRVKRPDTAGLRGNGCTVFRIDDDAKVIAYVRSGSDHTGDVVVVANFGGQNRASFPIGLPAGGTWHVRLNSDAAKYGPGFGDFQSPDVVAAAPGRYGLPWSGTVALPAYSIIVLSR